MGDLEPTRPEGRPAQGAGRGRPGRPDLTSPSPPREPAPGAGELRWERPAATGADAEGLRGVLRSGTTTERLAAVSSVRPGPGVEAALVESLEDPESRVRAGAIRSLGAIARTRGTRALMRAVATDPEPDVRGEAVTALALILQRRIGPDGSGAAT